MAASGDKKPDLNPETAPDPDEDELDDLDDMLDEFQNTKIDSSAKPEDTSSKNAASSTAKSTPAPPSADADGEPSMEDFAKHIQQNMEDMLKELEQDPESMKQFEQLMKGFADPKEFDAGPEPASAAAAPAPAPSASESTATPSKTASAGPAGSKSASTASASKAKENAPDAPPGPGADANFQDTIRRTMERMKASSASADESAKNPEEDDMMAQLLKELAAAGGEGGDGDDSFSKMLLGMMEQLTNKEILYEPMKDLDGKFDGWLAENRAGGKLAKDDETRYREQRRLVGEIVQRFEKKGYSDANAQDREYIVDRMQQMQSQGAPPPDLVGDMAGAEAMMGNMDQDCAQQ